MTNLTLDKISEVQKYYIMGKFARLYGLALNERITKIA